MEIIEITETTTSYIDDHDCTYEDCGFCTICDEKHEDIDQYDLYMDGGDYYEQKSY